MLITTELLHDGLVVLKLSGRIVYSSSLHSMQDTVSRLVGQGRRGILMDFTRVQKVNMAGLAALVELIARHPKVEIAFCALPDKILKFVKKSGLDRGLRLYPDVETAQSAPEFKAYALTDTKAVLLCAGKGSRVAPLTDVVPKPMLDVAGRPTLHRILDHLGQFGLCDVILNPGHLGYQVIDYFQNAVLPDYNISFSNEGQGSADTWSADPIGSASTLKRLQTRNAAFSSDFLVLCGDALIDLDLADMMHAHQTSGADVTIAAMTVDEADVHKYGIIETDSAGAIHSFVEKPASGITKSRLANTGIYIFSPRVLDLISDEPDQDIACDLLPKVLAAHYSMQAYSKPFSWIDIGCGRDFALANQLCLAGRTPSYDPVGQRNGTKPIWTSSEAYVANRAKITGRCHVGQGAKVEAGAHIEGLSCIGAGAVVEGGTVLRNCIVMPNTHVGRGVWAENMIIHSDWAVDHTHADGSLQNREPLEGVSSVEDVHISADLLRKSA